jgi:hypothetical protein
MISGDPSAWDDFFQQALVPTVLSLVVETWDKMAKPVPTDLEDAISIKLYAAMKKGKDRNKHPFLIRYQDVEVDFDLEKETGRKDIVFYPSTQEEIYFCLEAKRLNATVSGVCRSLADEYVKKGMQRFVDRKYSSSVRHGGMLAYVLDGKIAEAIKAIDKNLGKHWHALRMPQNTGLVVSTIRPTDSWAKETRHHRLNEQSGFRLHHMFVAGMKTQNKAA